MKALIAAVCFMLAAAPAAFAQDKAKDTEKKAPTATEKSAKGGEMSKPKADEMKAGTATDKSAKGTDKAAAKTDAGDKAKTDKTDKGDKTAKKEPSEKQKAQQEKMKACSKEAGEKKMKGDDRKSFMKDCLGK